MKKRDSSRDHVPPKALFPNPKPLNLKTVRCCLKCHRENSDGDELIKVFSALGLVRSPIARELKPDVARAMGRSSWWLPHLISGAKRSDKMSFRISGVELQANKLYLAPELTAALDQSVRRIAIGLIFDQDPDFDASKCNFAIRQVGEHELESTFAEAMKLVGPLRYHFDIGHGAFNAAWDFVKNDTQNGLMIQSYFGGLIFLIFISPK
ncbi:MAG: hypothetical protein HS117_15710 [Verrucomicrobiaceae bacterium]|nr:hypothetical protein [Verrucomicrobiaceae bacterium]